MNAFGVLNFKHFVFFKKDNIWIDKLTEQLKSICKIKNPAKISRLGNIASAGKNYI